LDKSCTGQVFRVTIQRINSQRHAAHGANRRNRTMATKERGTTQTGYSIGVVSRLTGIHPETLRMWERRYGLVRPSRSQGRSRRYSDEDIRRLSLVKTLVDAGHQISTIAPMSMEQLQQRLEATSPQALRRATGDTGPCRVLVVGSTLPAKLAAADASAGNVEVAASFDDAEQLKQAGELPPVDALVVEYTTVQSETIGNVRRLLAASGAPRAIVVYGFGARQALRELESAGVTCLRAPAALSDIAGACAQARTPVRPATAGASAHVNDIPPVRQFTPQQLARISARAPVIACECPHHLVDLINSLSAFETYSLECQNKNSEDAHIHAFLHATSGHARALLEAALTRVAEYEGIDLS
jgi:DNA-binding transcriptional MerR regulator